MNDRLTDKSITAIKLAEEACQAWGDCTVGAKHVLWGLIAEQTGLAAKALRSAQLEYSASLKAGIRECTLNNSQSEPATSGLDGFLELCWIEAQRLDKNYIGTEHLLLAVIADSDGAKVLQTIGVNPHALRATILRLLGELYQNIDPDRGQQGPR